MGLLQYIKLSEWEETKHPRKGGQFAPKGGGGGGSKAPEGKSGGDQKQKEASAGSKPAAGKVSDSTQKALAQNGFTKEAGQRAQQAFDRIKDSSPDVKAVKQEKDGGYSIPLELAGRSALSVIGGLAVGAGAFALVNAVGPDLPTSAKLAVATALGSAGRDVIYNKAMSGPAGQALKEAGIKTEISNGKILMEAARGAAVGGLIGATFLK